jgi:hypothetical protein
MQGTIAELARHRDQIATALEAKRAENASIAAALSQDVEEIGAAHNALAELAEVIAVNAEWIFPKGAEVKFPTLGGSGDQPLMLSTPPVFGGRPRRLSVGGTGDG